MVREDLWGHKKQKAFLLENEAQIEQMSFNAQDFLDFYGDYKKNQKCRASRCRLIAIMTCLKNSLENMKV